MSMRLKSAVRRFELTLTSNMSKPEQLIPEISNMLCHTKTHKMEPNFKPIPTFIAADSSRTLSISVTHAKLHLEVPALAAPEIFSSGREVDNISTSPLLPSPNGTIKRSELDVPLTKTVSFSNEVMTFTHQDYRKRTSKKGWMHFWRRLFFCGAY